MKIYNGTGTDITLIDKDGKAYLTIKAEGRALDSLIMHQEGIKLDNNIQVLLPYVSHYDDVPEDYDVVITTSDYAYAVLRDKRVDKLFILGPAVLNDDGSHKGYSGLIRAVCV